MISLIIFILGSLEYLKSHVNILEFKLVESFPGKMQIK